MERSSGLLGKGLLRAGLPTLLVGEARSGLPGPRLSLDRIGAIRRPGLFILNYPGDCPDKPGLRGGLYPSRAKSGLSSPCEDLPVIISLSFKRSLHLILSVSYLILLDFYISAALSNFRCLSSSLIIYSYRSIS